MLIKSKFKDYYDYLSHVYGVDEKIVYIREPIKFEVFEKKKDYHDIHAISSLGRYWNCDTGYDLKFVCVCGKIYAIASPKHQDKWFYVKPENYEGIVERRRTDADPFVRSWHGINHRVESCDGFTSAEVLKLQKAVGAPVFTFKSFDYKIEVDEKIPNLGELGFASVISPEQLYQEIGHCLINVINDGPDMMPEAPMTNKEKIVSHGFDLKQSFRHRK